MMAASTMKRTSLAPRRGVRIWNRVGVHERAGRTVISVAYLPPLYRALLTLNGDGYR